MLNPTLPPAESAAVCDSLGLDYKLFMIKGTGCAGADCHTETMANSSQ